MKYNDNGEYKDIYVKAFDTLPVGTEVDYDGSVVPSGWSEVTLYEDFKNKVTFDSGNPPNAQFFKIGRLIVITYQSANKVWNTNDVIFTLPDGYRPKNNQIAVQFTGQEHTSTTRGTGLINTDGKLTIINNLSQTSQRILFNVTFVIEE